MYVFATNVKLLQLKKLFFAKFVKVLVLELFYGTRTRVHFSISVLVLVLEAFCGTRARKLSTRLHYCPCRVGIASTSGNSKLKFNIGSLVKPLTLKLIFIKYLIKQKVQMHMLMNRLNIQMYKVQMQKQYSVKQ